MRKFWRGHEDDFAFDEFRFPSISGRSSNYPKVVIDVVLMSIFVRGWSGP